MGILEETQQRKKFNREFESYLKGFYEDYSYLDEYSVGSHCDLMNQALLLGIDVSSGRLSPSDIHKIKRYNGDK